MQGSQLALYVWDPKAYMNFPQFQVWYREFDHASIQHDTGYRMLQADGYKALLSPDARNEFKSDKLKLVVSHAECTDQVTPLRKTILLPQIWDSFLQFSYVDREKF